MDNLYAEFGTRLRRARKAGEFSQDELALKTGIGRATIATMETGKQAVALHQLYSLCEALNVRLNQLLPPMDSAELIRALGEQKLEKSDVEIIRELAKPAQ